MNQQDKYELYYRVRVDDDGICHVIMKGCVHDFFVPQSLLLFHNYRIPCPHCCTNTKPPNKPFRTSYDTIKQAFTEKGFELLTKENEYKNNKQPLEYKCSCGAIAKIRYNDMRRGRKCKNCKNQRISSTLKNTLREHNN